MKDWNSKPTFRLSSSTVDDSSMGDSWLVQELLLGPVWCQLVSEAAEEAAVGR